MSLVEAVVVPSPPLLVPEIAGGSAPADAGLRAAVRSAVAELLAGPGHVVVVGAAAATGPVDGSWDWRPFGVARRGPGNGPLPLALAMGAWLLDDLDPGRGRDLFGVATSEAPESCARLGAELVRDRDVRLLVVGDGTARRSEAAPGHLDLRAVDYDGQAEQALADADPGHLLGLSAALGRELLAAGRAPWQVLAGAAAGQRFHGDVRWSGAPYGVAYVVARWTAA